MQLVGIADHLPCAGLVANSFSFSNIWGLFLVAFHLSVPYPPMDLDGYPVNCYLFRAHFPYRFHSNQTRHIREVTDRSNPLIERYLRLHELHEGLMNRSSQGHGAEPISLEMAAARQREADRLGGRTNIFVMFMVVALPHARGDTCKLTIPEINEIWDNQIGTFGRSVRPVRANRSRAIYVEHNMLYVGSVTGVRYHFNWSLDYFESSSDAIIKPDPVWGDDAGILLGIWDVGTEGTRVDIKSIPPCFPKTKLIPLSLYFTG